MTEALEKAVTAMTLGKSFDVTIICTTDDHQAEYWMGRLSKSIGGGSTASDSKYPMVLACSEDWGAGGAGNGLGTLYAYQKACKLAKEKHGVDLAQELADGKVSAALFHTAGKGTRMAPLPASENNNKPGVVSPILVFLSVLVFVCVCVCVPMCMFECMHGRQVPLAPVGGTFPSFVPQAGFFIHSFNHSPAITNGRGMTLDKRACTLQPFLVTHSPILASQRTFVETARLSEAVGWFSRANHGPRGCRAADGCVC